MTEADPGSRSQNTMGKKNVFVPIRRHINQTEIVRSSIYSEVATRKSVFLRAHPLQNTEFRVRCVPFSAARKKIWTQVGQWILPVCNFYKEKLISQE